MRLPYVEMALVIFIMFISELVLGYGIYLVPNPNTTFCIGVSSKDDVLKIAVFVIDKYFSTNFFSIETLDCSLLNFWKNGLWYVEFFHGCRVP